MYGNYKTDISFVVAQGTLLWQPVKFENIHKRCMEQPILFVSAFDNGLADRKSTFKSSSGYIVFKFGELPSNNLGVYAVKTCNFCRDSPAN